MRIQSLFRQLGFIVMTALSGDVLAIACDSVFSNAVGTIGGELKLNDKDSTLVCASISMFKAG